MTSPFPLYARERAEKRRSVGARRGESIAPYRPVGIRSGARTVPGADVIASAPPSGRLARALLSPPPLRREDDGQSRRSAPRPESLATSAVRPAAGFSFSFLFFPLSFSFSLPRPPRGERARPGPRHERNNASGC